MTFSTSQKSGVTILRLSGNLLGGPDAGALKTRLLELAEAGKKKIVLDLREVEFMNSSGLAMLINSMTTIRNAGGDLKLANASSKISALITVTRLGSVLESYPSVEEAVAAVRK
jgi:anti-sigma B factor antagonist